MDENIEKIEENTPIRKSAKSLIKQGRKRMR
jgi:hypothetical protein